MTEKVYSIPLYEENLAKMEQVMVHTYLEWWQRIRFPLQAISLARWLEIKQENYKIIVKTVSRRILRAIK